MRSWHVAVAVLLTALLWPAAAVQAKGKADLREAFATIRQAAQAGGEYAGDKLFTKNAFEGYAKNAIPEAQKAMLNALATATYEHGVRKGSVGIATVNAGGRSQFRMRKESGAWKIASPRLYATNTSELKRRNGRRAATAQLRLRRTNGPYGKCALCLEHASTDALACKNAIDIWVCHNDDIHTAMNTLIADAGKKRLSKVVGIGAPGDVLKSTVPIVSGHTYRVHCRYGSTRDFFVALRVKKLAGSKVDVEWKLLTTGAGAPEDIHTPTKREGPLNGENGLCQKE